LCVSCSRLACPTTGSIHYLGWTALGGPAKEPKYSPACSRSTST
jgi:hypothetical protein